MKLQILALMEAIGRVAGALAVYAVLVWAVSGLSRRSGTRQPMVALGVWFSRSRLSLSQRAKDARLIPGHAERLARGLRTLASLRTPHLIEGAAVLLSVPFLQQMVTGPMGIFEAVISQVLMGWWHFTVRSRAVAINMLTWPGYRRDDVLLPLVANGIAAQVMECQQEATYQVLKATEVARPGARQIEALIVDVEQLLTSTGLDNGLSYAEMDAAQALSGRARERGQKFIEAIFPGKVPPAIALQGLPRFLPVRFGFNGVCWRNEAGFGEVKRDFGANKPICETAGMVTQCVSGQLLKENQEAKVGFYDWWFLQMLLFLKLGCKVCGGVNFEEAVRTLSFDRAGKLLKGDKALWMLVREWLRLLHKNCTPFVNAELMKHALLEKKCVDLLIGPADAFVTAAAQPVRRGEAKIVSNVWASFLGAAGGFVWAECLAWPCGSGEASPETRNELARVLTTESVQCAICSDSDGGFLSLSPYLDEPNGDAMGRWLNGELRDLKRLNGERRDGNQERNYVGAGRIEAIKELVARGFLARRPAPEPLRMQNWPAAYEAVREEVKR